jgi:hypothetical protein
MGHWAKLNNNNRVERVIVADAEPTFLKGKWVQTSYNTRGGVHILGGTPLRKNFAGIGYTYDKQRDAFIPPKPGNDWVLNETTCLWDNPSAEELA